ncbi:4'-phosphopantetheinyl transferase family protein [Micromonospora haikouensis]|uniref:4'-phosphopantetheinyl transferase family protein n=1 Tax=Micromonospora haikouensis TaxID=686309 RepID=UPI003798A3F1
MSQSAVPGRDTVYVFLGRTDGDRPAAARRLLRRAGGALLGRAEAEIRVGRDAAGRPLVDAGDAVELPVSLSHAGGVVVVAARRGGGVGVDVERRRELPALALADRWYAPQEAAWLRGRPPGQRVEAFLLLWTAKEAVGKALGRGLRDGGLRRPMPVPGGPGELLRPVPGAGGLRVGHPRLPAGGGGGGRAGDLVLALAVDGPADGVELVVD